MMGEKKSGEVQVVPESGESGVEAPCHMPELSLLEVPPNPPGLFPNRVGRTPEFARRMSFCQYYISTLRLQK